MSDCRESPALDIIGLLQRKGARVEYSDPYVPALEFLGNSMKSYEIKGGLKDFDCVVIVTNHSNFDYAKILREARLLYDARNATAGLKIPPTCKVVKL